MKAVICCAVIWFAMVICATALNADSVNSDAETCTGADAEIKALTKDLNRNAFAAAEARLATTKAAHPGCPYLLLAEARIKAAQGATVQASDLFSQYLQLVPGDAAGTAYFARFLIDQDQYQQADDLSAAAFEHDPSDSAALAVRGQLLAMKRQASEGLELLKKSCEVDPENAESQFQLGTLYDRAKRPSEAAAHFQKVVDLDPDYASAWDYLALNLEPLGQVDRADGAYKQGLKVNHEGQFVDSFLDYNYGRFLAKRNQLAESKVHLDRAVELAPDFRATWYDRAKLNLRTGNYGQARTDAERALSLTAQTGGILDLQVYALLEQIYRRLGEKELADKYAELTRETPPPVRKGYELAPQQ
jgi:tetratricopeptide (TPR) repeat protein